MYHRLEQMRLKPCPCVLVSFSCPFLRSPVEMGSFVRILSPLIKPKKNETILVEQENITKKKTCRLETQMCFEAILASDGSGQCLKVWSSLVFCSFLVKTETALVLCGPRTAKDRKKPVQTSLDKSFADMKWTGLRWVYDQLFRYYFTIITW